MGNVSEKTDNATNFFLIMVVKILLHKVDFTYTYVKHFHLKRAKCISIN